MHEEGMVSLLSDTRTHLPEAPGHPFLRAVLTEKSWPLAPSAAPSKCSPPVIAMATDQMARNSKHWFPSSSGGLEVQIQHHWPKVRHLQAEALGQAHFLAVLSV